MKLRGTLFSTVPTNIDDKNLTKNKEQKIFRVNKNLLWMRFWSVRYDSQLLRGLIKFLKQIRYGEWKSREKGERYEEVGRERESFGCSFVLFLSFQEVGYNNHIWINICIEKERNSVTICIKLKECIRYERMKSYILSFIKRIN